MVFGFVGVGRMGSGMAKNLCKKFRLKVYDTNRNHLTDFKKLTNAAICESIEEFTDTKRIFLMLPDEDSVKRTCLGDFGLFGSLTKTSKIYDCSTISPKLSLELHRKAKSAGIDYIDSPVSGGIGLF